MNPMHFNLMIVSLAYLTPLAFAAAILLMSVGEED